jgi:hypothetical protein
MKIMTNDRTILITGVTGNQGGAVAQALQGTGFYLRGLTRTPNSQRAAALAGHGIEVVILSWYGYRVLSGPMCPEEGMNLAHCQRNPFLWLFPWKYADFGLRSEHCALHGGG